MDSKRIWLFAAAGAAAGVAGYAALRRRPLADLRGSVALVTGASRGLGLELARQLSGQGCRLIICSRSENELREAASELGAGGEVLPVRCDVGDQAQVEEMFRRARERFGRVDLLINNAGVIQVGPLDSMSLEDFESAMRIMFWGVVYPSLAALPEMLERRSGRIVNITSIGGKVSVPHLLPYSCAKSAAVAFSEGLRAEVASRGLEVLTVVPGLMRTGSYLNAMFKGNREGETTWFSLGATLPLVSMDARRAAGQVVTAIRRGEAERILSLPAALLARFHGLFPSLTTNLLARVNRVVLPGPATDGEKAMSGREVQDRMNSTALRMATVLGRRAAPHFRN